MAAWAILRISFLGSFELLAAAAAVVVRGFLKVETLWEKTQLRSREVSDLGVRVRDIVLPLFNLLLHHHFVCLIWMMNNTDREIIFQLIIFFFFKPLKKNRDIER